MLSKPNFKQFLYKLIKPTTNEIGDNFAHSLKKVIKFFGGKKVFIFFCRIYRGRNILCFCSTSIYISKFRSKSKSLSMSFLKVPKMTI